MCGISGYLNTDSGVNTEVLMRMNHVIRHRGPDDEGYALIGNGSCSFYGGSDTVSELSLPRLECVDGSSSFLGLGHRRLSILDLSVSGHQPMQLADRDITVVYNGEIFNFIELRAELEALGYHFQTTCDTEILLYAYCQWGEACLEHFNGMWGFALWDGKKKRLFCARDRLGAKPFHYWHQGNKFLFGSELKQLCQDGSIERRFDKSYLAENLLYRLTDYNDQTLIEGMHALRPGHKLTVQLSMDGSCIESVHVSPYWELNTTYQQEERSFEEWKELVAAEFTRSCKWRLRSDAPLAALLSGGLDSSCLVTEICGQLSDPSAFHTFTNSYPGHSDCDEWQFAEKVNQACGCQGHQICPDPSDDIASRFAEVVWHLEGAGGLDKIGQKILLDDIHRRGFKVVLNGQCGDEVMLGYERYYVYYFFDLLKKGQLRKMVSEYKTTAGHQVFSILDLLKMTAYFNLRSVRDRRQTARAQAFVDNDLLKECHRKEVLDLLYPKSLQELQKRELTATNLPLITRYDDRLYMSASIESRIPFMDYQFVELAARIPASMKIRNGYTKYIMRDIFDSRMPKEVTWRMDKMGFQAPNAEWGRKIPRDYLMEQIRSARTAAYFRRDGLEKLVQTDQGDRRVAQFLEMELFAQQFDVD